MNSRRSRHSRRAPRATPLGGEPALFAEAESAIALVQRALEEQRRRLAAATVAMVLARAATPGLDRLLQAIQACDLDGIARALDAGLAAHIRAVLGGAPPTPLDLVAARHPKILADNLETVVAELRSALVEALSRARGGAVVLATGALPWTGAAPASAPPTGPPGPW